MQTVFRLALGWIASALATTIVAIILQTQNVLSRLSAIGADISLVDRLSMTVYDVFRLGSIYLICVAIGTCIAYLTGWLLWAMTGRMSGFARSLIFMVAGATAMLVMLLAMKEMFFGVHLIAGARDGLGIGMQMVAGALGGWLFAYLTRPQTFSSAGRDTASG